MIAGVKVLEPTSNWQRRFCIVPNKGLGKGFDSLFPEALDIGGLTRPVGETIQTIALSSITPNPDQPRRHFDEASLADLAQSIKTHGIIQPLIVTPHGSGTYQIIAGERRWRAASAANLKEVPVVVRSVDAQQKIELALIENVQRQDLNPVEQAVSIVRLKSEFNLDYETIAARLGKAYTTVINLTRLLQLPKPALESLQSGAISEGHARAILALRAQPEMQQMLLEQILAHGWTVRQAEQFAVAKKKENAAEQAPKASGISPADSARLKALSGSLKTVVKIERKAKGGRLVIGFNDDEELDNVLERLKK
jgi:ParB family chromosome partitioning protein